MVEAIFLPLLGVYNVADLSFDFLFIGGGIMGSSAAMALSEKLGTGRGVGVIDVDLEGEHSSTLKNAGGVRATWRNRANIALCKYSIDFYRTIGDRVQFRELGYYWLHNDATWRVVNANHPLYEEYGLRVELHPALDVPDILPFVDNLKGIAGLSISRNAGLIDHYSLREYYRAEARKRGVEFLDGLFVREIALRGGRAEVVVAEWVLGGEGKTEAVKRYLTYGARDEAKDTVSIGCKVLINTAGAWSPRIAALYGFEDRGIKARRRQMSLVSCPGLDLSPWGMIIDTSDVYFHQEGEYILAGYSNMDEEYGYKLDFTFGPADESSQFFRYIWAPLYSRISGFERLKLIRGWAGLYAETPDRSGYLGRVEGLKNVYECGGHTGRGLMISYGAGAALADLIVDGRFREGLESAGDLARERPSGALYEELHL